MQCPKNMAEIQSAADRWIASKWMGKYVVTNAKAAKLKVTPPETVPSKVIKTMWDEKGALHCQTESNSWRPASILDIIEEPKLQIDREELPDYVVRDVLEFVNENPSHETTKKLEWFWTLPDVLDAYLRWNGVDGFTDRILYIFKAVKQK